MSDESEPKKPGRPLLDINPGLVELYAERQYSYEEIAAKFGCSRETIRERFSAVVQEGRKRGQAEIKEMLWQSARMSSSVLLHMAKHYLGQHDRQITMTNEELAAECEKRLAMEAQEAKPSDRDSSDPK